MAKTMVSKGGVGGEITHLPLMWPEFKSRRWRHMRVEFVIGSLPYPERFFSGNSGFPLSLKTNTSKFQFDLELADTFKQRTFQSYVGKQITRLLKKNYAVIVSRLLLLGNKPRQVGSSAAQSYSSHICPLEFYTIC